MEEQAEMAPKQHNIPSKTGSNRCYLRWLIKTEDVRTGLKTVTQSVEEIRIKVACTKKCLNNNK